MLEYLLLKLSAVALANKNVVVTGYVDDPYFYIKRAKVFVAPMVSGSGIQNKILEAMSLEKAVVTTSIEAEGVEGENNIHFVTANDPVKFAEEVIELLDDEEKRRYLGENARRLILAKYTWKRVGQMFLDEIKVAGGVKVLYRARAPLRLGLAGGGTDVSPYSDTYGGAILNATISLYAYATIEQRNDGKIIFEAFDRNERAELEAMDYLEIDGKLDIFKGVYNRIVSDFTKTPLSFKLSTYVDAPPGAGLGTSSTLTVAVLGTFVEWLRLPLGEYDIAYLAYKIERKDLGMAGGKQDQYAATFGGFNFMEFYDNDKVIVNPLRIKSEYINELQLNLLLYYTGTSRLSSKIIEAQQRNVASKNKKSIEAMHKLKEQAVLMKEAILKGELTKIGEILDLGWQYKKQMAEGITNPVIDEIYETAKRAGATGGKISGAGGGGFMMFYCPGNTRYKVIEALQKFGGEFRRFQFTKYGLTTWSVR